MLDVSFALWDSRSHSTCIWNKQEDEELYSTLFTSIAETRQSQMVTGPRGESIWGIPMVTNGCVDESFIVIHRKPSAVIPLLDTDGNTTITRIQQTAERAIITLVEDVLRLLSYQQESEQELDSLASELSLRYEELNFIYKIGTKAEAITDFMNTLHYLLQKTGELIDSDYIALYIPPKNIFVDTCRYSDIAPSVSMQQAVMSAAPALLKTFSTGIDYLSDHDCQTHPYLSPILKEYKRLLTIPISFDEKKEGIIYLAKNISDASFTIADKRLVCVVADMIAIKIINAELFDDLKHFLLNLMKSFVRAIEEKDTYTHGHSERVNEHALNIGRALGLTDQELSSLNFVSILHDIGKIGISEKLLNKAESLTSQEYHAIKEHSLKGYMILEPIKQLKGYLSAILYHHERIDGTGYPEGLSGQEIPLFARIIAVADTFDSMTSDRAYRKAKDFESAVKELLDVSGTQLDPDITRVFITRCLGIKLKEEKRNKSEGRSQEEA